MTLNKLIDDLHVSLRPPKEGMWQILEGHIDGTISDPSLIFGLPRHKDGVFDQLQQFGRKFNARLGIHNSRIPKQVFRRKGKGNSKIFFTFAPLDDDDNRDLQQYIPCILSALDNLALMERGMGQQVSLAKSSFIIPFSSPLALICRGEYLTNMRVSSLPMIYLGCLIFKGRPTRANFQYVIDKVNAKLVSRKGIREFGENFAILQMTMVLGLEVCLMSLMLS
ncbi:hypothetical protein ACH5RR_013039 [Cinchona calisaya]|uniref:Uncharacterized protein n=1 Tax=Cinchona calisaya TaxID=153742 RepID=A0ABD2ZZ09_9GENT